MRIRKNTNVSLQILAAAVEYSDPSLARRMCPVNQSPWDLISPVNQPGIFTGNGNVSLADSIGAQVNQAGIFTGNGNASLADSIGALVNQSSIFPGHGNASLADSIGAQVNQSSIFPGHGNASLADIIGAQVNQSSIFPGHGNASLADSIGAQVNHPIIFTNNGIASLADSIGVQQRGASKENPILLDEEEIENKNGEKNGIKNKDNNGNGDGGGNDNGNGGGDRDGDGDGDEDKNEYAEIPLLVVFGNKKKPTVYCGTKSTRPIKGSIALCKCHGPQPLCKCHRPKSGKTKTLDLLPAKRIYKPRATRPAHAYGDDGFYYYSGFAPSKRGSSASKEDENSDVVD